MSIDFRLLLKDETTYGEITEIQSAFTGELKKNFEQCRASIIIDE